MLHRVSTISNDDIKLHKKTIDFVSILGHRGAFDNVDFVFDLTGSPPSHKTPAPSLQPLGVA